MKIVIQMKQFKTTPGTVVYHAVSNPEKSVTPLVKSIYLTRSVLSIPYLDEITVTVEC